MKVFKKEINLDIILKITQGEVIGDENQYFDNVSELNEANHKSVCFYENEQYFADFCKSKAGLIFVPELSQNIPNDCQTFIKVAKPYFSFMILVTWWLEQDKKMQEIKISKLASVHPDAEIGENVNIEPFAVIGKNVKIGDNSYIGAHTVIMDDVIIGKSCKLFPNVVIYDNCIIGDKTVIHAGSIIGADGFGYVLMNGVQLKIPQVGNVVLEDDIEIGANTCIDRSTIGTTLVKSNTKIDNLVQVGHNCQIDEHAILCAQVGLAGNSHIGKTVYLAGQVGVGGHLKIDDNSMIGAQSGVASSLKTGKYFGSPAISAFEQKKIIAALKDIPTVVRYVKRMIKEN